MKKAIFISSQNLFFPSSGVESRVNNLVKQMSRDNNLFLIGPKQENSSKNYYGLDYKSRFRKLFDTRILKIGTKLNKEEKIDFIFATTLWAGLNGLVLSWKIKTPLYFDDHNVEFLRFKRTKSFLWPFVFLFELIICKFAKKVICVSEKDKEYFQKYFKLKEDKLEVIENPVDKSVFYPNLKVKNKIRENLGIEKNEKFVLFFGQLDYKPNVEAIDTIIKEIIPRLNKRGIRYKLVICGKGDGRGILKNFKHRNFIFKGFVEKIQDYINAADVIIAPLRSGSGTRIKILEALACNKKVISTTIGAEGIEKNKFLEIEDDWERFTEKI